MSVAGGQAFSLQSDGVHGRAELHREDTTKEDTMAARAGERAQKTGTFHCERCNNKVRVKKGGKIPKCPHCGNATYDTRTGEPGNKS
jgi:hypothetical protein